MNTYMQKIEGFKLQAMKLVENVRAYVELSEIIMSEIEKMQEEARSKEIILNRYDEETKKLDAKKAEIDAALAKKAELDVYKTSLNEKQAVIDKENQALTERKSQLDIKEKELQQKADRIMRILS